MRLCRFTSPEFPEPRAAILEGDVLHVLPGDIHNAAGLGPRSPQVTARVPLATARLLAPVEPSKVVGVGLNYRAHAQEMGKALPDVPRLFIKPSTAVIGPGDVIVRPPESQRVDHEGELGVVIGKRARKLTAENALSYVLGYTCANDVTARDLQIADVQFTRGKGFDTFCPLGPWVETELDPNALKVELRVNGQTRQSGSTADMVHSVVQLLVFITGIMTLLPGDVIATGTPAGVGPLLPGDRVEVEIQGIGVLQNRVE
ncbi:MAG: fumarylacetoacetate hydrolase family protein [Myxococcota bacterium]